MATSGSGLAITIGINAAIGLVILLIFGYFRNLKLTRQYYAPKRYVPGRMYRPVPTSRTMWGWIGPSLRYSEQEIIQLAGFDAAVYLRILKFGMTLFLVVSVVTLAIVLPVNVTGGEVDNLTNQMDNPGPPNPFTYWVPPPPPPLSPGQEENTTEPDPITVPQFYNDDLPPAPPGIKWWRYNEGVPPLASPEDFFNNASFANWGWQYDAESTTNNYKFTNLDKCTMANIASQSNRMFVHACVVWFITLFVFWLLWKYNTRAVELRILYLGTLPRGAETHTALISDIPGTKYGTLVHRLDTSVVGKYIPKVIKNKVAMAASKTATAAADVPLRQKKGGGAGVVATPPEATAAAPAGKPNRLQHSESRYHDASEDVEHSGSSAESNTFRDVPLGSFKSPPGADAPGGKAGLNPGARAEAAPLVSFEHIATETRAWPKAKRALDSGMTMEQMVSREYEELYGEGFDHAHLVHDTTELAPLVKEYETLKQKLTDQMDTYTAKTRKGEEIKKPAQKRVIGATYGKWGLEKYGKTTKQVDALEFMVDRMAELRRRMKEEQGLALAKDLPTAFVTFKTRTDQTVCVTGMQHHDLTAWQAHAAPRPDEIVWHNLGWRSWERNLRGLAIWLLFALLCMFFMIPVAAVQGIITSLAYVDAFRRIAIINSLIGAIVPTLALKIFLALLPMILRFMNLKQGMRSESEVDMGVIQKFFIFQVLTVYIGTFVASSLLGQLQQIIDNPSSVVTILGVAAPQTSIFFLVFILLGALVGYPSALLRIVGFVIYFIISKITPTERAKSRKWQNRDFKYGTAIPGDTITILIGLSMCVINPIIAPFCVLYFFIASMCQRYNFAYVNTEAYQTGGRIWVVAYKQIMVGIYLFQLTMTCVLAIKKTIAPPIIVALTLPLTAIYDYVSRQTFFLPQTILSLRAARDLDNSDAQKGPVSMLDAKSAAQQYQNPSFRFDEEEWATLQQEAGLWRGILYRGEKYDEDKMPNSTVYSIIPEDEKEEAARDAAKEEKKRQKQATKAEAKRGKGENGGKGAPTGPELV